MPLSINEAVDELTKTIEGGKGHVHLHIHEHTHRNVNECLNNYNHHEDRGI